MPATKKHHRFPLWLHRSGQWCKKHRGQFYYFGSDKAEAEARYLAEWPQIRKGESRFEEELKADDMTLRDLVNRFLTVQVERRKAKSKGISAPQLAHYFRSGKLLAETLGKNRGVATLRPDDFAKLYHKISHLAPMTVAGIVNRVGAIFNHAAENDWIAKVPKYGTLFVLPEREELDRARTDKQLTADQIRTLIGGAKTHLRAWILLGINCGYGQSDISSLPFAALASKGWSIFPRPKTGAKRRCPLWPETQEAIKVSVARRWEPSDVADAEIVFISKFKRRLIRYTDGDATKPGIRSDGIGQEYSKLAKRLGVPTGFYRLRHTFRTVADGSRDLVACDVIMGHKDHTMGGNYRGGIEDSRLVAVAEHVHKWLFGS